MTIIETLLQAHPVRKTKKQKEAFRSWFIEEAERMGYTARAEAAKGYASTNLVVGDPEGAKATFTAHYDTPPIMPLPNFITPKNILFYILYQLVLVVVIFGVAIAVGALAGWLSKEPGIGGSVGMLAAYAMLALMMFGPANKHCANDNTSGVAAVMEMMARLPQEERANAAFILFDNEEKGMFGSSGYAAQHKEFKKNGLLVNLDCVGDGENILFLSNKKTRELPEYALLEQAMQAQTGRNLLMDKMESAVYPSDQAQFTYGIAVCACNKGKVLGYYVDKIHTPKDTVCEQANLDFLADGLTSFVAALPEKEAAPASEAAPAKAADAGKKKWLGALLGLLAAIVGLALLIVYIKLKGDAPILMLMAGAVLFGCGIVSFFGKLGKEE